MSKLRITVTAGLVGSVLLVMLIFLGCENKLKGTERANRPPTIRFSNVPPDSAAFSFNPEVSWYALDIDGYVTKYQYAVIIADSLHVLGKLWNGGGTLSAVDSACSVLVRIPPEAWVDSLRHIDSTIAPDNIDKFISAVDTTVSIVKVQLFAKENPNDTITQHLLVRAIDNDNAVSNVIHRMFSRNNHPPKAHINYTPFRSDTTVKSLYCLPETTETWKGIKVTWDGSDSDDYRGTQPDFFYKWELWGPFADSFALTATKYNELVADSSHRLVASSFNKQDSTRLVEDKSLLLTGLVNYPHIMPNYQYPDSGHGWYLFIAWTLDDAFTFSDPFASSNPDGHLWFKIVHPQFTYQPVKKILVLNFSLYYYVRPHAFDSLDAFYQRTFAAMVDSDKCDTFSYAGFPGDGFSRWGVDPYVNTDTLSRWNLVVYVNEGSLKRQLSVQTIGVLETYLKVGGKVWAIGGSAGNFGSQTIAEGLQTFDQGDYGATYFGLLGVYNGSSTDLEKAEFVAANPYLPLGNPEITHLPRLDVDSHKDSLQVYWDGSGRDSLAYLVPRLPYSSYTYLGSATRIYTFISHPDNVAGSQMNDRPCGSVYKGPNGPDGHPIYKTADLSFDLHLMEEGENGAKSDSLFTRMLEWFWERD
jgi:hypothetical protein